MKLSAVQQEFVLHFGEMGSRWGINRTVGQIYALLFLSEQPLNAEQITDAIGCSRSNVSMGLKELQGWNLVRLRHIPEDRRDYFTTPGDLWDIVRTLVAERKKREIDPTLTKLREIEMQRPAGDDEKFAYDRIGEMRELIESLIDFYDDINRMPTERIIQLLTLGSKFNRLLEGAGKIVPITRHQDSRQKEA